jgi:hypothetical protein
MGGFSAVLFAAHVDVATRTQQVKGQGSKQNESDNNFPH